MDHRPDLPNRTDGSVPAIATLLTDLVTRIPSSCEPAAANPTARANSIIRHAALRSAGISGTLALPPGPLGMTTIVPDLVAIWNVQRQLVSDIASCFGKRAALTSEVMVYCLFRHGAAMLVRDLVVRMGERMLVKRAALRSIQKVLRKLGVRVAQRTVARAVSRYLPVLSALGVGGYSYYDTLNVGKTAVELFSKEIDMSYETLPGPADACSDRPSLPSPSPAFHPARS